MNIRMLGPTSVANQTRMVNGRTYTAAAGVAIDVPDFDAQQLHANHWIWVAPSGPTSARPTTAPGLYRAVEGAEFFDTTLNYLIIFDGAIWRSAATGAPV